MDETQAARHETGHEWVKLQADNYEAIISVARVMSYPSTYLATLLQFELQKGSPDPAVRLDCGAEEAKEVVAVLRQVQTSVRQGMQAPPTDAWHTCHAAWATFYGIHDGYGSVTVAAGCGTVPPFCRQQHQNSS
jgi:hypothetical protein